MTKEDVKDLLKFIIRKCDLIINNESYTADEYAQDKIEDIAEMCHRVLDGQFGEIIEPSQPPLPSNLDAAAELSANDAMIKRQFPSVVYNTGLKCFDHSDLIKQFKAGAEWMAGQGLNARKEE